MSGQATAPKGATPNKTESPSKLTVKNSKSSTSLKRPVAGPSEKPAKSPNHPKYLDMVVKAIQELKERNGSSRQAILKFILRRYNLNQDAKLVNGKVKMALKRGLESKTLKQIKGQGASGSFRLATAKTAVPKKVKKEKKVKSPVKPKVKDSVVAERKAKQTKRVKKEGEKKTAGVQKKKAVGKVTKAGTVKKATTAKGVGLRTAKKIAAAAKGKIKRGRGRPPRAAAADGKKNEATA